MITLRAPNATAIDTFDLGNYHEPTAGTWLSRLPARAFPNSSAILRFSKSGTVPRPNATVLANFAQPTRRIASRICGSLNPYVRRVSMSLDAILVVWLLSLEQKFNRAL